MGFWHDVHAHGEHAGKQVGSEGRRVSLECDFFVTLVPEELLSTFVQEGSAGFIPRIGVLVRAAISERPETMSEALDDGLDERTVGMIRQQGFKHVDFNGGDDFKQMGVAGQGRNDNGVIEDRTRDIWQRFVRQGNIYESTARQAMVVPNELS